MTFTATKTLPPARATGDIPVGGVAADFDLLRDAILEVQNAGLLKTGDVNYSADALVDGTQKVVMTTTERINLAALVAEVNPDQTTDPFWIPGGLVTRTATGGTMPFIQASGSNINGPQFSGTVSTQSTGMLSGVFIPSSWTNFRVRIWVVPVSTQATGGTFYMGAQWQESAPGQPFTVAPPVPSTGYVMSTGALPVNSYGIAEIVSGPFVHDPTKPVGTLYFCRDRGNAADTASTSAILLAVGVEKV